MKRLRQEEIRDILSNMVRGKGYYDFDIVEVCFDRLGRFKVYHNYKLSYETKSMKDAVNRIDCWMKQL